MKKTVTIIGGGPAALIAAAFLDSTKHNISIYEKEKTLGRKFLVAGNGGFNLTHADPSVSMLSQYWPRPFIRQAFDHFDNSDLREWLLSIGIDTYVGSSGRVFPVKGIKPIHVLNAIIEKLYEKGVQIHCGMRWEGWTKDNDLLFDNGAIIRSDYSIFALGGASWSVTGSDGQWRSVFSQKAIKTKAFEASNCGVLIDWSSSFINNHEGQYVKNISLRCNNYKGVGELVFTKNGIEGNALYAIVRELREQLKNKDTVSIYLDAKPTLSSSRILEKLIKSQKKNMTENLKSVLKIPKCLIDIIKSKLTKEQFLDNQLMSKYIKSIPLEVHQLSPIEEAISTVGGLALDELDRSFQLKKLDRQYCIGEMLDWDTITGGYLLQACFSMGVAVSNHINEQFKQFFDS